MRPHQRPRGRQLNRIFGNRALGVLIACPQYGLCEVLSSKGG